VRKSQVILPTPLVDRMSRDLPAAGQSSVFQASTFARNTMMHRDLVAQTCSASGVPYCSSRGRYSMVYTMARTALLPMALLVLAVMAAGQNAAPGTQIISSGFPR